MRLFFYDVNFFLNAPFLYISYLDIAFFLGEVILCTRVASASFNNKNMLGRNIAKIVLAHREVVGTAGCRYVFQNLIQERSHLGWAWLARSEGSHCVCL